MPIKVVRIRTKDGTIKKVRVRVGGEAPSEQRQETPTEQPQQKEQKGAAPPLLPGMQDTKIEANEPRTLMEQAKFAGKFVAGRTLSGLAKAMAVFPGAVRAFGDVVGSESLRKIGTSGTSYLEGVQEELRQDAPIVDPKMFQEERFKPTGTEARITGVPGSVEAAGEVSSSSVAIEEALGELSFYERYILPGISDGLESFGAMLPAYISGTTQAGKELLGRAAFFINGSAIEANETYNQMRNEGFSVSRSIGSSVAKGLSEGVWESVSGRAFMKIPEGQAMFKRMINFGLVEIGTEEANLLTQRAIDLFDKTVIGGMPVEKALNKYFENLPHDMFRTAVAAATTGIAASGLQLAGQASGKLKAAMAKGDGDVRTTAKPLRDMIQKVQYRAKNGETIDITSPEYNIALPSEELNQVPGEVSISDELQPSQGGEQQVTPEPRAEVTVKPKSLQDQKGKPSEQETMVTPEVTEVPETDFDMKEDPEATPAVDPKPDFDFKIYPRKLKKKTRGNIENWINNADIAESVIRDLRGDPEGTQYAPQQVDQWVNKAAKNIATHGVEKAREIYFSKSDSELRNPVGTAIGAILADDASSKAEYDMAAKIIKKVAKPLTEAAQTVKSADILRGDPILNALTEAQRGFKAAKVEEAKRRSKEGTQASPETDVELPAESVKRIVQAGRKVKANEKRNQRAKGKNNAKSRIQKATQKALRKKKQAPARQVPDVGTKSLWEQNRDAASEALVKTLQSSKNKQKKKRLPGVVETVAKRFQKAISAQAPKGEKGPASRKTKDIDVLIDAVRNQDKFPDMWNTVITDAQNRLSDSELNTLDDFFNGATPKPFNPKTLTRFTKKLVKQTSDNIYSRLYKSPRAVQDIRKEVRVGIDALNLPDDVKSTLEQEITGELENLIQDTTKKVQGKLAGLKIERDTMGRLSRLYHLGIMDNKADYEQFREQWGLPELSVELKQKFNEAFSGTVPEAVQAAACSELIREVEVAKKDTDWGQMARAVNIGSQLLRFAVFGGNILDTAVSTGVENMADFFVNLSEGRTSPREGLSSMKFQIRGLTKPKRVYDEAWQYHKNLGRTDSEARKKALSNMVELARLNRAEKYGMKDIKALHQLMHSNRFIRLWSDSLTLGLSIPDLAFFEANFNRSIAQQTRKQGNLLPTAEQVEEAKRQAAYSIFENDTAIGRAQGFLRTSLNKASTAPLELAGVKSTREFGLGDVVTPYTKVPGAVTTRKMELSPIGFVMAASDLFKSSWKGYDFDSDGFKRKLIRATMGSLGSLAGFSLASMGWMVGDSDDEKIRRVERESFGGGLHLNFSEMYRDITTLFGNAANKKFPRELKNGDVLFPVWDAEVANNSMRWGKVAWDVYTDYKNRKRRRKLDLKTPIYKDTYTDVVRAIGKTFDFRTNPTAYNLTKYARMLGNDSSGFFGSLAKIEAEAFTDLLVSMASPGFVREAGDILVGDKPRFKDRSGYVKRAVQDIANNWQVLTAPLGLTSDVIRDTHGKKMENLSIATRVWNTFMPMDWMKYAKGSEEALNARTMSKVIGEAVGKRRTPSSLSVEGKRRSITAKQRSDYEALTGKVWAQYIKNYSAPAIDLIAETQTRDFTDREFKLLDAYAQRLRKMEQAAHKAAKYVVTDTKPSAKTLRTMSEIELALYSKMRRAKDNE